MFDVSLSSRPLLRKTVSGKREGLAGSGSMVLAGWFRFNGGVECKCKSLSIVLTAVAHIAW